MRLCPSIDGGPDGSGLTEWLLLQMIFAQNYANNKVGCLGQTDVLLELVVILQHWDDRFRPSNNRSTVTQSADFLFCGRMILLGWPGLAWPLKVTQSAD